MQALRNARLLTRLVLVWFALFIGASVASPLVKPQTGQMVCSAIGGLKMVSGDDDAAPLQSTGSMECPLCAHVTAQPPPVGSSLDAPDALAYALRPIPAARIAWLTGSPLPPRGPPARS